MVGRPELHEQGAARALSVAEVVPPSSGRASPMVIGSGEADITAGRYRLIFELGRGGMADVLLGVIEGPGGFHKLQVLKFLRQELAGDPEFCTMFLDEARLSARINHPNVAQTNEVGFDGQRYFIAMEYLEGHSLEELMRVVPPTSIPLPLVLRILADACSGLHYAHQLKNFDGSPLNVIHRDVSPHNIFVTYDGVVKLLDFGIAKASDSKSRTEAGTIKGKIAYMAPEQLIAPNGIDCRADIFSVGAILWRLITGTRLWTGATEMEVLRRLSVREIPQPVPVPGTPDELVRICKKAIAADRDDRYPSAIALQSDLESLINALGGASYTDVATLVNSAFADRRREVKAAIDARLASPQGTNVTHVVPLPRLSSAKAVSRHEIVEGASITTLRPARSSWSLSLAAGLVAVGLVAAAYVARPKDASPTAAPAESVAPQESARASGPSPTSMETDLTLDVTPANAQVFVDDVALTGKPPRGTFAQDRRDHTVRVQADGYTPKTTAVMFSAASVRVEVTLDKERRASTAPWRPPSKRSVGPPAIAHDTTAVAAPPPTVSATVTTPSPSASPPPRAARNPNAALDKDDPWKR